MARTKDRSNYRDAGDGKFVTKAFAENNKQMTVRERVTKPAKLPRKKKR